MSGKSLLLLKQENLELRKENEGLKETVTKLLEELDRVQNSLVPVESGAQKIILTPEQQIIEDQIKRLQAISITSTLDIDEVRALDILIKNKKLLEKNQPIEPEYDDLTKNKSDEDLLRLAGNVEYKRPKKSNKSEASKKDSVE